MITTQYEDKCFHTFNESTEHYSLPEKFNNPFQNEPHPLCILAVEQLQQYLRTQQEWVHNFGKETGQEGTIIGKMFGVLVVKKLQNEIGFLSAFSGKLAGSNRHTGFVPPVFDALTEGSFLNIGMAELNNINLVIRTLEAQETINNTKQIDSLMLLRKNISIDLQNKLFDHYYFLNRFGEEKNLRTIFRTYSNTNPPAGAGECSAPKLLQYAFKHNMQPLAIAEFWWGLSPKSEQWKHGHFYPSCQQKCAPILSHMLQGIEMNKTKSNK